MRTKKHNGYILLYYPQHHCAQQTGHIPEHRVVWEEHHHACLLSWAHVHHINRKRDDNRIENLEAMMNYEHNSLHAFIPHMIRKKRKKYLMTQSNKGIVGPEADKAWTEINRFLLQTIMK